MSAEPTPPRDAPTLDSRELWEGAADGLVLVDATGTIRDVNPELERLFGWPPGELVGEPLETLVPMQHAPGHDKLMATYFAHPIRRPIAAGRRLLGRRRDGTELPVLVSLSPQRVGDELMVLAAVRDVSRLVDTEDQLASANRRRAVADDRARIARDLHDTVIQDLFAAGLGLQALLGDVAGPVADRVSGTIDDLDAVIRRLRQVIYDLDQPLGADTGLRAAVSDLVSGFSGRDGDEPDLRLSGPLDTAVADRVRRELLPTVHELLSNAVRHGQARHLTIDVVVDSAAGEVLARVTDDGVGLPPNPPPGRGLRNLRERAAALGGTFTLAPGADGRGTTAEWRVPVTGELASTAG